MYTLLIVDDESWIREGLARSVPWESCGISRVLVADCVSAARELLRTQTPDLLITDVVMPDGTGLELLTWARQRIPSLPCLVISGHEQFSFVQQALRGGASDYILKPIDESLLLEAAARCLEKRRENASLRQMAGLYARHRGDLRQLFLMRLAEQPIRELREMFGRELAVLRVEQGWFAAVCLVLPGSTNEGLGSARAILNGQLEHQLGETACWDFILRDGELYLLLADTQPLDNDRLLRIFSVQDALLLLNPGFSCCLGPVVSGDCVALQDSFVALCNARQNAFCLPHGEVCAADSIRAAQNADLYACQPVLDQFSQGFAEGGPEWGAGHSGGLIDALLRAVPCIGRAELGAILFRVMSDCARQARREGWLPAGGRFDENEAVRWAFDLSDEASARDRFREFFLYLRDCASHEESSAQKRLIRDAAAYIRSNYARDLTVDELAGILGISNSYFSQLFTREQGVSFSRFLSACRMDQARELLRTTNKRIYDIAAEVGYADVKYFLRVFKKAEGVTPQAYRDRHR